MLARIMTGWYGIPGKSTPNPKVHIVADGIPICGIRLTKKHEFQWCGNGVIEGMVECENCKKLIKDGWVNKFKKLFNIKD